MTTLQSKRFVKAWLGGAVCLHPTDTLPGLSANPLDQSAVDELRAFKQRDSLRSFISLVPDFAHAQRYWLPLPPKWKTLLLKFWPGPLSVVWKASALAPAAMVGTDGTIALRCPRFSPSNAWMHEVLREVSLPLPTTSVNRAGEPPHSHWAAAKKMAESAKFYVPEGVIETDQGAQASTLIRIKDDGGYELLRAGALKGDLRLPPF
jgi:tRNA threonylcarbamoyl adenosine modification protein (Sua5/YciO/YrdC/YwlC family)